MNTKELLFFFEVEAFNIIKTLSKSYLKNGIGCVFKNI